jgi:hypothetical protein
MSDAKAKGKTIQHQDLTTDTATVLVEAEEDWAGLATCEPSGQRCSGMNIGASSRLVERRGQIGRALDKESQDELGDMSN